MKQGSTSRPLNHFAQSTGIVEKNMIHVKSILAGGFHQLSGARCHRVGTGAVEMGGWGAPPYDLLERASARRGSVVGKAGRCQRRPGPS
jgi:hypothetical protein